MVSSVKYFEHTPRITSLTLLLRIITFIFYSGTSFTYAQWFPQNSGTIYKLNKIIFINETVGTAVGDSGVILRTTNSGTSWFDQSPGTGHNLHSICFTDLNNGTAVGDAATLLQTTNGGITWDYYKAGAIVNYNFVCFRDSDYGIIVGTGGLILKTSDGGYSWMIRYPGIYNHLYCYAYSDSDSGTAVGMYGTILRTTDGGTTWNLQLSGSDKIFFAVDFAGSTGLIVGEDGIILRSADRGASWNIIENRPLGSLYDVHLSDSLNATAVGAGGTIIRSSDGGITWISQLSGTSAALYGCCFTDENRGTVVGDSGIILRTINGGWVPVELMSFTAETAVPDVILNWATSSETNNSGFNIERKTSDEWAAIGFVSGHGTTSETNNYTYTDDLSDPGNFSTVYYRLKQVDYDGSYEYSKEIEVTIPPDYNLAQNYPNPFNPSTTINYSIPVKGKVLLIVYDALGNEVRKLVNEEKAAGKYKIDFNANGMASGIYFYQLFAGDVIISRKMILLR